MRNLDRSFFRFVTDEQTDGQTAFSWLDRPEFSAAR